MPQERGASRRRGDDGGETRQGAFYTMAGPTKRGAKGRTRGQWQGRRPTRTARRSGGETLWAAAGWAGQGGGGRGRVGTAGTGAAGAARAGQGMRVRAGRGRRGADKGGGAAGAAGAERAASGLAGGWSAAWRTAVTPWRRTTTANNGDVTSSAPSRARAPRATPNRPAQALRPPNPITAISDKRTPTWVGG